MLRMLPKLARLAIPRTPQKIFAPLRQQIAGMASQSWSVTQKPKFTRPVTSKLTALNPSQHSRDSECIARLKADDKQEAQSLLNVLKQFNIELSKDQHAQLETISTTCQQNLIDLLDKVTVASLHQELQLKLIINTLLANPNYLGEICKAFLTKRSVTQDFLLTPEWINSKLYDLKLMDEIRVKPGKPFGFFSPPRVEVTKEPAAYDQEPWALQPF